MCDRDNEIPLNKQVKFKDLKIMLVKIMKYAVIYFMIYTIWRNCYHLANLHSSHVGRMPAAIAYIVYIGKNKFKPNSSLVHVQTQEARITIYSVCPHRFNRPTFSFIDTKFGVPFTMFTDKFLKRSSLFITL